MAKVLVAEDDQEIRRLLADILDDDGREVMEASDGIDTLERIPTFQPDLLALDLMMPRLDGFEVPSRLRSDPATQDLPVVVISAVPPPQGELRGWRLGVKHYIPKPFEDEHVQLSVKIALSESLRTEGS
ncbi:MAG: response regulator [SAR202 cluster bacterium]|jgi:CheY-like chemotaxis protein|nr:response regulator [SAR202 cluster bacterium]MDP7413627.1 response regulator [SAR202 cluster bacterium]